MTQRWRVPVIARVDQADATIDVLGVRIGELLDPTKRRCRWWRRSRVSRRTARVILAEIGADLPRFPDAGHLASWRTAVVTGAGSGIGRATWLEFARRGCSVAVVDIDRVGADRKRWRGSGGARRRHPLGGGQVNS